MRRKIWLWIAFLLMLLVISISATSYSKTVDLAFMAVRFSVVMIASVLVVREWWLTRHAPGNHAHPGSAALRRMRAWYYDDNH